MTNNLKDKRSTIEVKIGRQFTRGLKDKIFLSYVKCTLKN